MPSLRKESKQQEAAQRQEEREKRSPLQQLARLDQLLGMHQGAKKERARLQAQLVSE